MTVNTITGNVIERNPAIFMRRVTGSDGETPVVIADISALDYDVWIVPMTRGRYQSLYGELPPREIALVATGSTAVPEHIVSDTLVVADCFFDTLQTDAKWTKDEIGYNFLVELDALPNFPEIPLAEYPTPQFLEILFNVTPASGNPFVLPFVVLEEFSLAGRGVGTGT